MGWICEYCSTANEDGGTQCFVCAKERSKNAIREDMREARRAKRERIEKAVYDGITLTGKILFLSSVAVFSVVALIILYLKMQDGALDDLAHVGVAVLGNAWQNIAAVFGTNLPAVITQPFPSPLIDFSTNIKVVCLCAYDNIRTNVGGIATVLFDGGGKYSVLAERFVFVKNAVVDVLRLLLSLIALLAANTADRFASLAHNATEIFRMAKEQIMSFGK